MEIRLKKGKQLSLNMLPGLYSGDNIESTDKAHRRKIQCGNHMSEVQIGGVL
jgi:hypothetical protein